MTTTKTYTLYWIREDGQGDFNMGDYETRAAAEAAIPAAEAELLGQAGEEWQKDEIRAGSWSIEESEDEGEDEE